jgi:type II restriction/modification system DNA methylase subunit YeeA
VVPFFIGDDIAGRSQDRFIVDFDGKSESEAAQYEQPFSHISTVKSHREAMSQREAAEEWWLFWRRRPELSGKLAPLPRFIATPRVSKHRIFVWARLPMVPDNAVVVIARDDDISFGILHSQFHEAWSLRLGTWLGVGNDPRYTPTTTFETFPFPAGLTPNIPAADYAADPRAQRIAAAAKTLDDLRRAWLNPPDLVDIVPEVTPTAAPGEAPRRYPDRILPKTVEAAVKLKARTLTNLYNQRPRWLADAHDALDRAVAAAYGWPEDIATDDALQRLLALNLERAAAQSKSDDEAKRAEAASFDP